MTGSGVPIPQLEPPNPEKAPTRYGSSRRNRIGYNREKQQLSFVRIPWFVLERMNRFAKTVAMGGGSGVLCGFFTEAEKISVEIFNIEVLTAPWPLREGSNDVGSPRFQLIK